MHILLIHQAFAHPDEPGGTRHYELARELVRNGHSVTVVAGGSNYLTGREQRSATSAEPGIQILRVRTAGQLHRSYTERALGFVHFAAGALRAARSVAPIDLVWGTSPPLVQLLPAWLVSLRTRAPFVLEERDLWPEFAVGMGVLRDGLLARGALRFKQLMYRRASRIVLNSPGFLPTLRSYGVPAEKIEMIPNGVDVEQFAPDAEAPELRADWGGSDRFVVVYAGALGPANALDTVIDAAERLRETPALFVLVGDGKARPALMQAASARGLDNVRFVPAQPKREMARVLAAADACLASLRNIPLFTTTYPNKVFDYMAAGRPVVLAIDGVIREVVEEAGAGIFATPDDAPALASAVRELMQDPAAARAMGRRGRRAVCERFDRRGQAANLERLFGAVVARAQPPAPESGRAKGWALR
jgi:glycosyltransferase involved in cell wall biosynthesis